jgi:hypothetical protein
MALDGGPHLIDMATEAKIFNFRFFYPLNRITALPSLSGLQGRQSNTV